ncbi:hypothetical protein OH791_33655 [Streptomyces anulatus]|uniref:hypothetical protein n=1 Tax=Streptomyces anulatus TaxID=1892 RepID=UPI00386A2E7B|nr:hypothetical protein OH791_33655 [Streptomyces anulatus]
MSPYVSNVTDLFFGDLATISATIHGAGRDILNADIDLTRQEADGIDAAEIVTHYVAARGDYGIQRWLRTLAAEHDEAQPFGPRLLDELDELDGLSAPAAA